MTATLGVTLSAEEWIAVASLVGAPLPGIDLEAYVELDEGVRLTGLAAGVNGLIAHADLTFSEDQLARFSGPLAEILETLNAGTRGLTLALQTAEGQTVTHWVGDERDVVELCFEADGTVVRLTGMSVGDAIARIEHALGDEHEVNGEAVDLGQDDIERLIAGSSEAELTSSIGPARGLSIGRLDSIDSGEFTETVVSWLGDETSGRWLV